MNDRVFLDTNVVLYAYDRSAEASKRESARRLLREAARGDGYVISPQVTGEFFVNVTRKFQEPLSLEAAARVVDQLLRLELVEIDGSLSLRAIQAHRKYQVSYWDGLILAAAERGRCGRLYSEDLSHGQRYFGVEVVNPFLAQGS